MAIFINSFPRSGHHMLVEAASAIFPGLSYCEKYKCADQWNEEIECPGKDIPLALKTICRAGKHIQKSHDFDLTELFVTGNNVKYFVLMRNPVPAIISWWKLHLRTQAAQEDTRIGFQQFFVEKFAFWNGFGRKWLRPGTPLMEHTVHDRFVFATYEQLTTDTDALRTAVRYLIPARAAFLCDVHTHVFEKIVRKSANDITNFEYFDSDFFEQVISGADPEIARHIEMTF